MRKSNLAIGFVAIGSLMLFLAVYLEINTLRDRVNELSNFNLEPTIIIEQGQKGEKGDQGDRGYTGYSGADGEAQEGHWERFCLFNKNKNGYPTKGVLIREDTQGDCDDDYKVIKLWEK